MVRNLVAAAAVATFAAVASADTVDMKFVGTGKGHSVKIIQGASSNSVFAGQLKHNFSNGTGVAHSLVGDIVTFCTDLSQYVTSTTKTYEVRALKDLPWSPPTPTMGIDRAHAIEDLFSYAGQQAVSTTDNAFAAAFQIAVWEICKDFDANVGSSSLDVNAGNLKVKKTSGASLDGSILSHLTSMFGAIGTEMTPVGVLGVGNKYHQDQLVLVPLPAPALLAGLGLVCIATCRRRYAH